MYKYINHFFKGGWIGDLEVMISKNRWTFSASVDLRSNGTVFLFFAKNVSNKKDLKGKI